MNLVLEPLHLKLKVNWRLSRNSTNFKNNFIVKLHTPEKEFLSEIAPNIRYDETPESIRAQFNEWMEQVDFKEVKDAHSLTEMLDRKPLQHSFRFGIESVFLSYLANKDGLSLSQYLGLPSTGSLSTSFSMPIMPVNEIADYLKPLSRFHSLKIKVNSETGAQMLDEIHKHTQVKLRVDANEAWRDFDAFMRFLEGLKGMNIELIEQPFPSSMQTEYEELKKISPYKILADESIEDVGNFSKLSKQFHAVNIKLMKTGSLLKARDLITEAKLHGMETMIGCMIETTVGISYGMLFGGVVNYVDLDGFLLVKDEPFRLVKEAEGLLSLNN